MCDSIGACAGSGQLHLSGVCPYVSTGAPAPAVAPPRAEECTGGVVHAVECPVGCRGTSLCLCGQGELSDYPVWIERDLGDR